MTIEEKVCGIVMPISDCDGQGASHWLDVKSIIETAAKNAGFQVRLVSDTFESNLIHKEILQNVYQDDIIICDVSGRNPNVFFELGIRMATQKPTVIVKDNKTTYPFDTGPNRYIEYPRDLRHPEMEAFKSDLIKALKATINQKKENSFIGQLGPFQIPDVESKKVPESDLIINRLDRMEKQFSAFFSDRKRSVAKRAEKFIGFDDESSGVLRVYIQGYGHESVVNGLRTLSDRSLFKNSQFEWDRHPDGHFEILISGLKSTQSPEVKMEIQEAIEHAIPF